MDKQKKLQKQFILNSLDTFLFAESRGYIVRPDGSQIVVSMASPGEVTWHQMQKQMLMDRQVSNTSTQIVNEVEIKPSRSTVEIHEEKTAEALRRARGGGR